MSGVDHEPTVLTSNLRTTLQELADAAEEWASSEPDMPSAGDSERRFDAALAAARTVLSAERSPVETGAPPEGITWLTRGKPDFAHWRKDAKVPYSWCDCVSCKEARDKPANHNPFHAMERRLEAAASAQNGVADSGKP